jgi:hypothetical protein
MVRVEIRWACVALMMLGGATPALAKKWQPPAKTDNKWETAGNWAPNGVPGQNDDVEVPATDAQNNPVSYTITTNGGIKTIKSFTMVDPGQGRNHTLKSSDNAGVILRVTNDIVIGANCRVWGLMINPGPRGADVSLISSDGNIRVAGQASGGDGQVDGHGGIVELKAPNGTVTIDGTALVVGGTGGAGKPDQPNGGAAGTKGQDAGDITISAKTTVTINGTVAGRDGGSTTADNQVGGRGGAIFITSTNSNVIIGKALLGGKGGVGADGGYFEISAVAGKVTVNAGVTITGGEGGPGRVADGNANPPVSATNSGSGGHIQTNSKDVDNGGIERGGKGGSTTQTGKRGGDGGDVKNTAVQKTRGGKKFGGAAGTGDGEINNGLKGKGEADGGQEEQQPGDQIDGSDVTLRSAPLGIITLVGLGADAIHGDSTVVIDGRDFCTPIDLRGNPAGINVITAGRSITIVGSVFLDPGVTLASITEPDATVSPPCTVHSSPAPLLPSWGLALIALLLVATALLRFRRAE